MDVFQWSDIYLVGIPEIDEQHQQLVELVNRLGEWASFGIIKSEFDAIVAQIFDYAATHFEHEDHIWAGLHIDVQHRQGHAEMHGNFVRQMRHMQQQFDNPQRDAPIVHSFLTAWLVYHILGEDKRMARLAGVVVDIPDELVEIGSTSILHSAVQTLYLELSQKNAELVALNNGLEQKVAQRTAELDVARVRLMENERLASVGQLAAGVAHEINNPLGFVSSNLYSLGEYVHDLLYLLDACIAVEPTLGRGAQAIQHIHSLCEELDLPFIREDITKLLNESREGLDRVCLKIRSAVILKDDRCLLDGLQALADSAFPKRCNNCGRTFDSVRDFIAETVSVRNGISGAKASRGDDEEVIVELYRNCVCGSTLMDFFFRQARSV